MSNSFSKKSLERLNTCDPRIIEIMHNVLKVMDFSVICGHRGEEEQNQAYEDGNSRARWGFSMHNTAPSRAIDIAPYPIDWEDKERFARLAGIVEGVASQKGYKVKWGGDFKSIKDMPHFEIVG